MNSLIRLFFILAPAVLVYIVMSVIDSDIAFIFFIGVFYLGYEVTKPEPRRGEKFLA